MEVKQIQQYIHQWAWLLLVIFSLLGLIFSVIGLSALLCMLAPVVVAFFKGRRWCGFYCPRGSFLDLIPAKFTNNRRIPGLFHKIWVKISILSFMMGAFMIQIILARGSIVAIGQVFMRMIILTTFLAIILGIVYKPRTWCLICPMGFLARNVAEIEVVETRIRHVVFNRINCSHCKICSRSCPVAIDVYRYQERGKVVDPNCLKCMTCINKCPKKSLYVA